MDRLLDDADFGDGFLGVRDRMILEVFYETGVRRSELIGLNDADVDFSSCVIKVTGKRNKQRLIPFGEELERDLRVYLSVRDENISERENDAFLSGRMDEGFLLEWYTFW